MRRIAVFLMGSTILLAILSPGALYLWGLSVAQVRPKPDPGCYFEQEIGEKVWEEIHEEGPTGEIEVLNPWRFLIGAFLATDTNEFAGYRVASMVAENAMANESRGNTLKEIVARSSVIIWLTRNWSEEQILCRATQIVLPAP